MLFKKNTTFLIFVGIYGLLVLGFIGHYSIVGQAVYGDGRYYYAYVRSLVKDNDIEFLNEFSHHYSPESNNSPYSESLASLQTTATGMTPNIYPIGSPLFWLPTFYIIDRITLIIPSLHANGYSDIYQINIGILNVTLGFIGLIIVYHLLLRFFSRRVCIISIIALGLGSNLFYYISLDVINSHPTSFFISALFAFYWYIFGARTKKKFLILGVLVGLLSIIRTQDIIFLSIPFLDIVKIQSSIKMKLQAMLFILIGFIIPFSIQMGIWHILYNNPFSSPYMHDSSVFNFLKPHFWGVLFNEKTGLLLWTPIYYAIFIGIYLLFHRRKDIALSILMLFLLQFYIISSWGGWMQGESFGIRMLISGLPFYSIALGQSIEFIDNYSKKISIVLTGLLIIFTMSAILYFLLYAQNTTFDREHNTQDKSLMRIFQLLRT